MNFSKIINLATPTESYDAVTKDYVDTQLSNAVQGLDAKQSVKVASTVGIGSSGFFDAYIPGAVVDGYTLQLNDRILVKNETGDSKYLNGIYVIAQDGPNRAFDFDAGTEITSAYVFVEEGTSQENTGWVCTNNSGAIIGTTPIEFVQFSSAGLIEPGTNLSKSGNTLNVVSSPNFTGGLTVDTTTLVVDATNNRVGIGSSAPSNTLDVLGDSKFTGDFTIAGTSATTIGGTSATINNSTITLGTTGSVINISSTTSPNVTIGPSNGSRITVSNTGVGINTGAANVATNIGTGSGTSAVSIGSTSKPVTIVGSQVGINTAANSTQSVSIATGTGTATVSIGSSSKTLVLEGTVGIGTASIGTVSIGNSTGGIALTGTVSGSIETTTPSVGIGSSGLENISSSSEIEIVSGSSRLIKVNSQYHFSCVVKVKSVNSPITKTSFLLSLPNASTFTNPWDIVGSVSGFSTDNNSLVPNYNIENCMITAVGSSTDCKVSFTSTDAEAEDIYLQLLVRY